MRSSNDGRSMLLRGPATLQELTDALVAAGLSLFSSEYPTSVFFDGTTEVGVAWPDEGAFFVQVLAEFEDGDEAARDSLATRLRRPGWEIELFDD